MIEILIVPVKVEQKDILKNLIEKYEYEFSQYNKCDVDENGLFNYEYLDLYWQEEKRWPYFVLVDGKIAGFTMVNTYHEVEEDTDYTLSEFFIMHKYRRLGIGKYVAMRIFNMFHGKWQLKCHPNNIISVQFWDNVINEYTRGEYKLIKDYPNSEYEDGTLANVYLFNN